MKLLCMCCVVFSWVIFILILSAFAVLVDDVAWKVNGGFTVGEQGTIT